MKRLLTIIALFASLTAARAQFATYTQPNIHSGFGGSGRAVSFRDRGHFIDVRRWISPNVQYPGREGIHVYPPVTSYGWWTQGGVLFIRPVGTTSVTTYNLHLYGTDTDAIVVSFPANAGITFTVEGLVGTHSFGQWITLPVARLCRGTFTTIGVNNFNESLRFSPVSLAE